jgi:hypothetical protein
MVFTVWDGLVSVFSQMVVLVHDVLNREDDHGSTDCTS